MFVFPVNPDAERADGRDPAEAWGEVPEADRYAWSRYMLDYCPLFPGASIMTFIARGVVNGGDHVPQVWKETAAELHEAGFTPLYYYLLAQLLSEKHRRNELDEAAHGHLFKQWYGDPFPDFRLDAKAWEPWVRRVVQSESPGRALQHMLHGTDLPALGMLISAEGSVQEVRD